MEVSNVTSAAVCLYGCMGVCGPVCVGGLSSSVTT